MKLITVIIFIGYKIKTNVVSSLIQLTQHATALGKGCDVDELLVTSDDEIGQLGHAFNLMRENVRSRAEDLELQAHYDPSFSQAVTSCSSRTSHFQGLNFTRQVAPCPSEGFVFI